MSDVTIFAPSPTLTVTIETQEGVDEIHVHAGGQGVWQARMLRRLGLNVMMCCALSGEIGQVIRHLLQDEEIRVLGVTREGSASAYVQDRRDGERTTIAEEIGEPLGRHDLDELYSVVLREGLRSKLVILSGPADEQVLPADTYRRLAADLRQAGCTVIVDLAGARLAAALEGGVDVLKVSDEELRDSGLLPGDDQDGGDSVRAISTVMHDLRHRGAETVIVTRASEPLLLLDGEGLLEVTPPELQVTDSRGAGDSLTAGVVAGMVRGETARSAITLGAAAGAMNVTRHGLGTGDQQAIVRLRETVRTRQLADIGDLDRNAEATARVSPGGLAALADTEHGTEHDGEDRSAQGAPGERS